jgi:hypothetical protein
MTLPAWASCGQAAGGGHAERAERWERLTQAGSAMDCGHMF